MKKKLLSGISVILIVSLVLSLFIFGKDRNGIFSQNPDDYITDLIDTFGMSSENYFAHNWVAEINGQEVPFERKNEYQEQYLLDLIETTLQYIGNTTYVEGKTERAERTRTNRKGGNRVIEVAMAELGTKERTGKNDCIYNDWYYGKSVKGDSYDWCVVFVAWVANECGLLDDGSGQNIFRKCAGTGGMYNYLITHGQTEHAMSSITPFGGTEYTPKPGDIFFLYDTSGEPGWLHIGFIAEVHDDYLVSIEGNWGGQVTSRELKYSDPQVKYGCCIEINYPSSIYSADIADEASEDAIYDFCISIGMNTAAACGVIANISEENSIFDTGLYEYGSGAGYGLIQWTGVRRDRLFEWLEENGYDRTSFEGQMYFMLHELQTDYDYVYEFLMSVPDTAQGAYDDGWYWCYWYERPGAKETSSPRRGALARDTYYPIYSEYTYQSGYDSYFDDSLFIGDSRIVQLMNEEALETADGFCKVGIGNTALLTTKLKIQGVGTVTLEQLLSKKIYDKIYLCNGINQMGSGVEGNFNAFKMVYELVREKAPDAIIYIQSIIPTSLEYRNKTYPEYFDSARVAEYNAMLKELCDEDDNTYFIDVARLYTGSDGYLDMSYSNDGLHITYAAQEKWIALLKRNKK